MIKVQTGVAVGALLCALGLCRADAIHAFDTGAMDWQAWEINNGGRTRWHEAEHTDAGDPRGGYISADIRQAGWRLYGMQPPNADDFAGTLEIGGALMVETWLEGLVTGPTETPTARFYIGSSEGGSNYWVSNNLYSWALNDDQQWTGHMVELLETNFLEWPNQASRNKSFAEVLASADDIGLVFTGAAKSSFRSNRTLGVESRHGATLHLDNFGALGPLGAGDIPEPATMSVIVLGAMALVMRRTAD